MPRIDQDTADFAKALDGPKSAPKQLETALRTARSVMQDPKKFVARKALAAALVGGEGAEKIAAVDPVNLFHMLTDRYKQDWWEWEPETLWHSLQTELGNEPARAVKDLISALQVTVTTNAPFEHWHIFENVANALAGNPVDFGILQPIELTDAARAIRILLEIRPKMVFDEEVWGYVAALAREAGVVYLPPPLFGGATTPQDLLDRLNNDLELKAKVAVRWPKAPTSEDDLALKIQLLRLRELEEAARA